MLLGDNMIFDVSHSEFSVVDVLKISRDSSVGEAATDGTPYTYLSCRLSGHSEIITGDRVIIPDAENYLLCPEGSKYTHKYLKEDLVIIHLKFSKNPPGEIELIHSVKPEIKELFLSLYNYWSQKQPGYQIRCKSIVLEIFYQLFIAGIGTSASKISASMEYLYSNFSKTDFDISEMISKSYISPAYFRRIFLKTYGTTVAKFLNRMRIDYAKSLIESRKYTIRQTAYMSGFYDEKYFSKVFKASVGCPPSEYLS